MTQFNPEQHTAPDALLTPKFFEAVRGIGGVAVEHSPEDLAGLNDFMQKEAGVGFPAPIDGMDFAYYLNVDSRMPWKWDTHYVSAKPGFEYVDGGEIPPHSAVPVTTITKAEIASRGTEVVEVQVKDLERPGALVWALARTLLIPRHGDPETKLIAGPGAWVDQAKQATLTEKGRADALDYARPFAHVGDENLQTEASRRFPAAAYIRTRGLNSGSN
jgi:hypothetical protein